MLLSGRLYTRTRYQNILFIWLPDIDEYFISWLLIDKTVKADFLVIDIGFGLEFFKSNLNFPAYDTYIKLILILTESKEFFGK